MVRFQIVNENFAIVEDIDRVIDIDKINDAIDHKLRVNNLIPPETQKLYRVVRDGNIISFNGHALYVAEYMMKLLPLNIKYEPCSDLLKQYSNTKLPDFNILNSEQRNGPAKHAMSIDEHVKSLVNALNTIHGVRTFASCDGHGYKFAYVLFYASDIQHALNIIDKALCMARVNYTLTNFIINYHISLDSWDVIRGDKLSYEVRIHYRPEEYITVCEFLESSSKYIEGCASEKS